MNLKLDKYEENDMQAYQKLLKSKDAEKIMETVKKNHAGKQFK